MSIRIKKFANSNNFVVPFPVTFSKTSEPQSEVKMNSDDDEEMTVDNESIQKERVSRDKERKQFLLKAKKKIKRVLKVNTSEQPQHVSH
jgi:hypothetical protein